jgi:dihydrofolate reductase
MIVNLITATGKSGQIGIKGDLPWKYSPVVRVQQQMKADLKLFRHLTFGKDLIMGERTAKKLKLDGRTIHVYRGEEPGQFLHDLSKQGIEEVWLAGGAYTYERFALYVNGLKIVNIIDYDNGADTYFPFHAYGIMSKNNW